MLSWKINVVFILYLQRALSTALKTSVADPHPACHFDANPDPNFQIKAQNLDGVTVLHLDLVLTTVSVVHCIKILDQILIRLFRTSTILKINCFEDTQKEEYQQFLLNITFCENFWIIKTMLFKNVRLMRSTAKHADLCTVKTADFLFFLSAKSRIQILSHWYFLSFFGKYLYYFIPHR